MKLLSRRARLWLLLALVFPLVRAPGQDVRPDATQPATDSQATTSSAPATQTAPSTQPATSTAPAEEPNPFVSPRRMLQSFAAAVAEERLEDAARAMNFTQVDDEVRKERGAEFVQQLVAVLDRLRAEELLDAEALPEDPAADSPQTLGKDPLLLTIERVEQQREGREPRRVWQFSASTVKSIPEIHGRLDELVRMTTETAPAPPPVVETPEEIKPEAVNRLRSPYHMMEFFLIKVTEAQTDEVNYAEAIRCLDFSLVPEDVREEQAFAYVDNLNAILTYLREQAQFDRDKLPRDPARDTESVAIGKSPFEIIIVRQARNRWRFSAQTVKRIPEMVAALTAAREARAAAEGAAAPAPPSVETIPLDLSSPRATLHRFLDAMNESDIRRAVSCLDLSELSEIERTLAPVLAGKLWLVLNRHGVIVVQEVPTSGTYTILKNTAGRVEIAPSDSEEERYKFTTATVDDIDALYRFFERKPVLPEFEGNRVAFWALPSLYVREYLVPDVLKTQAGPLQQWQWWGLAVLVLFGLLLGRISQWVLPQVARSMLATEATAVLPRVAQKAMMPTSVLVVLFAWWSGLQLLDLGATVTTWAWVVLRVVMTAVAILAFTRLIDLGMGYILARAAGPLTEVLAPLMAKTLKVVVVVVGVIILVSTIGFNVGPLLAGLGLGGLAFGLAAQDTLKNFFGSVNVVLDRPFQVGDWIKVGEKEGMVEAVGLRSSRIRTFYNSQLIVPNSDLMVAQIDNMGRRQYRRISCMLSVLYSTPPERLEAFCEGIRELIRRHPYTRKDYYQVYVNQFSASSIDILLYCFHEVPDWSTELRERHRLFLDVIRLARRTGVEFAFPTQTVHLHHESNPPDTPPKPPPTIPEIAADAQHFGRDEAAGIVRSLLGDKPQREPPPKFP